MFGKHIMQGMVADVCLFAVAGEPNLEYLEMKNKRSFSPELALYWIRVLTVCTWPYWQAM